MTIANARLHQVVRKIHILAGAQAAVGLLLFSVSALVAAFPVESEWQISHALYRGIAFEGDLELARALHREIGSRFEQVPEPWMVERLAGGTLLIRFFSPNGWREARLDRDTKRVEIRSKPAGLGPFLNYMHQESIGRRHRSDSLWLWAWSVYLESLLLALFVLPLTGSYLWMSSRPNLRFAQVGLGLSVSAVVLLWIGLR